MVVLAKEEAGAPTHREGVVEDPTKVNLLKVRPKIR